MKIRYLGTGASEGVPGLFCECEHCKRARRLGGKDIRARSQALVDDSLLIDLGDDTYLRSVQMGVSLSRVGVLLVTHSHADHFNPRHLGFRGGWFAENMAEPVLRGYGSDTVCRIYGQARSGFFDPVKPCAEFRAVRPFEAFAAGDYTVTALPADHDPREQCLFYAVERDGRRLLYANDTGVFPESVFEWLAGRRFHLVSLDCTGGPRAIGSSHMGLPDNIAVRDRMLSIGAADAGTRFVCTHISHAAGRTHGELEALFAAEGFTAAWDGMQAEI